MVIWNDDLPSYTASMVEDYIFHEPSTPPMWYCSHEYPSCVTDEDLPEGNEDRITGSSNGLGWKGP